MGTELDKDVVDSAFQLRKTEKAMLAAPIGPQKEQANLEHKLARKRFRNVVDNAMKKRGES